MANSNLIIPTNDSLKALITLAVSPSFSDLRDFDFIYSIGVLTQECDQSKLDVEGTLYFNTVNCIHEILKDTPNIPQQVLLQRVKSSKFYNPSVDEHILELSNTDLGDNEAGAILKYLEDITVYGSVEGLKADLLNSIFETGYDNLATYRDKFEYLDRWVQSVQKARDKIANITSNKESFNSGDKRSLTRMSKELYDNYINPKTTKVIKTGIKYLNILLAPGYSPGSLYTYMGTPGGYKSGMVLKAAVDCALYNQETDTPKKKRCAIYVTMENTFRETLKRLYSYLTLEQLTREDTIETLLTKIEEAIGKLPPHAPHIIIKYFPYKTINTSYLNKLLHDTKQHGYTPILLAFDYIKRIKATEKIDIGVKPELNAIMNELKAIASSWDIPIVTAQQMNRSAYAKLNDAARQGKSDNLTEVGAESIGDAWEVQEVSDWTALLNIEWRYDNGPLKPSKVLTIQRTKIRDQNLLDVIAPELQNMTYFSHPFSKQHGFVLDDDLYDAKSKSIVPDHLNKKKEKAQEKINELVKVDLSALDL